MTITAMKKKINDRTAKIGIIGLGYVGLPLAVELANVGFNWIGNTKLERNCKV